MGVVKQSKVIKNITLLKETEISDFHSVTSFNRGTILTLHQNYNVFSSLNEENGLIEYPDFCLLISKNQSNLLAQNIFNAIDTGKDNAINFREFLRFLSSFHKSLQEEQKYILFNLYSGGKQFISKENLYTMLKNAIKSDKVLSKYLDNDQVLNNIIQESFETIGRLNNNSDGKLDKIDLMMFTNIILERYPMLGLYIKIDIDFLKNRKVKLRPVNNTNSNYK